MSAIDDALKANEAYARSFAQPQLPRIPKRKLAVVTCMDCRIDVERILGLEPGDAHVLRNAGALVTDDVLRSLIISHHLLGTEEIMIIGHTQCGMTSFTDDELRANLAAQCQASPAAPASFGAFADAQNSIREQAAKIRSHPWLPCALAVRGFLYDVETGRLGEIDLQTESLSYDLPPLCPGVEEAV